MVEQLNLNLEAGEYIALQRVARKFHLDIGMAIRTAIALMIQADSQGALMISEFSGRKHGDADA